MGRVLEDSVWWDYIDKDLKALLTESALLLERVSNWNEKFLDYSFVVFPAAKAYEGFLKTLFLDLGFITKDEYLGKRFRIGRVLNPALEALVRERESVYDKIVAFCGGREIADALWETWKDSRNLLFHWFPNERNVITLEEARDRIASILSAMDIAFRECRIKERA